MIDKFREHKVDLMQRFQSSKIGIVEWKLKFYDCEEFRKND